MPAERATRRKAPASKTTKGARTGRPLEPPVDGRRRVAIERLLPEVDAGRFRIKRTIGDVVNVTAHVHADGHDVLVVQLRHRAANHTAAVWTEVPMHALGNDEWQAAFTVDSVGIHQYTVEAWVDHFLSWRREIEIKVRAGLDVAVELTEGAALVAAAARRCAPDAAARGGHDTGPGYGHPDDHSYLHETAEVLAGDASVATRTNTALDDRLLEAMMRHADRALATTYARVLEVWVDRERARFGAWYEMFPRSWGPSDSRSATFAEAAHHLRNVAAMGFDVVYLPPIHPIGTTHRKGRGNTLVAAPGDPGSPWAIGSPDGGHKAVEPALGSLEDFDAFVADARRLELEIALDLAFQCSPDHPYVQSHPEWFRHRPDGTIKYAENPPKKYQDIYPFDFETSDWRSLWDELESVVRFWIGHGVRIFRVDNPHTKPHLFWEWLIERIHRDHPDVLFLSEAFTRPKVMAYLAKLGFTQSYSYFTWRNTKDEIETYFSELTGTELVEFLRPNLFANTPDILHRYLQEGGPAAFRIRLILAATLGASYGIYSGFELCEGRAVPNSEEYLDSEKYQIRKWDWDGAVNIKDLIAAVNRIRREHHALQHHTRVTFHVTDNQELVAYTKRSPDGRDPVLVVVSLDPRNPQDGWIDVPPGALDVAGDSFSVRDLLTDQTFTWTGTRHYVRLTPDLPAHILVTAP